MDFINTIARTVKKNSPAILTGLGIFGVVTGTVIACKEARQIDPIIDEHKAQMDGIHDATEKGYVQDKETNENVEYTEKDARKDTTLTYLHTGFKFAKLFLPSVIVIGGSLFCFVKSYNILDKRNIGLAAAYTGIYQTFEQYRENIKEKFGEAADVEARYNIKAKKVKGKNGEEDTYKYELKEDTCISDVDHSRFFRRKVSSDDIEGSRLWDASRTMNLNTIYSVERNLNRRIGQSKSGILTLNAVYDALDLRPSKDGNVLGYIYNKGKDPVDEYGDPKVVKILIYMFDEKKGTSVPKSLDEAMNDGTILDVENVMLLDFAGLVPITSK